MPILRIAAPGVRHRAVIKALEVRGTSCLAGGAGSLVGQLPSRAFRHALHRKVGGTIIGVRPTASAPRLQAFPLASSGFRGLVAHAQIRRSPVTVGPEEGDASRNLNQRASRRTFDRSGTTLAVFVADFALAIMAIDRLTATEVRRGFAGGRSS